MTINRTPTSKTPAPNMDNADNEENDDIPKNDVNQGDNVMGNEDDGRKANNVPGNELEQDPAPNATAAENTADSIVNALADGGANTEITNNGGTNDATGGVGDNNERRRANNEVEEDQVTTPIPPVEQPLSKFCPYSERPRRSIEAVDQPNSATCARRWRAPCRISIWASKGNSIYLCLSIPFLILH